MRPKEASEPAPSNRSRRTSALNGRNHRLVGTGCRFSCRCYHLTEALTCGRANLVFIRKAEGGTSCRANGAMSMVSFHRILFPVDFSGAGAAMAPAVYTIARKFDASVTIMNAFNLVHDYDLSPHCDEVTNEPLPVLPVPYMPAFQELRNQRESRLQTFVNTHFRGVSGNAVVVDGEPALAIEWLARREQSDLITMPTRGLGRFRRLLLGSVTAKVLHDLDCPVFTSAHEPELKPAFPDCCNSLLCALEFDSEDEAVLRMAASLARAYTARVCLLHIMTKNDEQNRDRAMASARRSFEEISRAEAGHDIPIRDRSLDATVPEGIRQVAIEEEADLVIVGRGRARETVSFLWSQLYRVIRESPCPVLSV